MMPDFISVNDKPIICKSLKPTDNNNMYKYLQNICTDYIWQRKIQRITIF